MVPRLIPEHTRAAEKSHSASGSDLTIIKKAEMSCNDNYYHALYEICFVLQSKKSKNMNLDSVRVFSVDFILCCKWEKLNRYKLEKQNKKHFPITSRKGRLQKVRRRTDSKR
eukprot:UN15147